MDAEIPNTEDVPVCFIPQTIKQQPMPIRKAHVSSSRILVADDDPQVRKLFVRSLRAVGYSVSEAKSGAGALKLLRSRHFPVLVLDLDMPDTDGFEVLRVVKAEHPNVRVLVISGYMNGALLGAGQCLGATLSLRKTSPPGVFVKTVQKLMGDSG